MFTDCLLVVSWLICSFNEIIACSLFLVVLVPPFGIPALVCALRCRHADLTGQPSRHLSTLSFRFIIAGSLCLCIVAILVGLFIALWHHENLTDPNYLVQSSFYTPSDAVRGDVDVKMKQLVNNGSSNKMLPSPGAARRMDKDPVTGTSLARREPASSKEPTSGSGKQQYFENAPNGLERLMKQSEIEVLDQLKKSSTSRNSKK